MRDGKNNFPALANTPFCVFIWLLLVGKSTRCDSSSSCSLPHSAFLETGKLLFTYYEALWIHLQQCALWGSLLCKQIFFRLILISFVAHACSINGDLSLRDMKTTAFSYPYTQRELNSDSSNHKAVRGLLKSNFKQQTKVLTSLRPIV